MSEVEWLSNPFEKKPKWKCSLCGGYGINTSCPTMIAKEHYAERNNARVPEKVIRFEVKEILKCEKCGAVWTETYEKEMQDDL